MKTWKIKNISERPIKISVAIRSNVAPGLILQKDEFCLSMAQMTAPLDKQSKCGFVSIDKDFNNDQGLELGKAYNITMLDTIKEKVKEYVK
jgi:hypothetical protein